MRTRYRLLFIALVGVWLGGLNPVGAAPAASRFAILCGDVCSSGASCGDECWLTQFEFDNEYPSTTCGDEGYSCCGDGFCDTSGEGCGNTLCGGDCTEVPDCDGECPCGPGQVCNAAEQCVPYSGEVTGQHTGACGGECTSNDDCCGIDKCQGAPGQGYCAIPSTDYCPDAPACSGTLWGTSYTNCDSSDFCPVYGAWDAYCDPGTDRCMFNEGYLCVDPDSNICYTY